MASSRRHHLSEDQKEGWSLRCVGGAGPKTFSPCKYMVFPLSELGSPSGSFEQEGEMI